jgi:hypothetical protein
MTAESVCPINVVTMPMNHPSSTERPDIEHLNGLQETGADRTSR